MGVKYNRVPYSSSESSNEKVPCKDCRETGKPCNGTCGVSCKAPINDISECYKNIPELTCTSIRAATAFIGISAEKALLQNDVFTEYELADTTIFSISWSFLIGSLEPTCIDNVPAFAKIAVVLGSSQLLSDTITGVDKDLKTFIMDTIKKYIAICAIESLMI